MSTERLQTEIELFQDEIERLVAERIIAGDPNFSTVFSKKELDKEDMVLYMKFRAGTLTESELGARMMDIQRDLKASQKQLNAYMSAELQNRRKV